MRKYLPLVIASTVVLMSACSGGNNDSAESGVANTEGDFVSVSNGYFNNSRVTRDGQGNHTSSISYEVDTESNRIKSTELDADQLIINTGQTSYSDRGYLLEDNQFNSDGQQWRKDTYTHDARGYLTSHQIDEFNGNDRSSNISLEFDDHNKLKRKEKRDLVSGELMFEEIYKLDGLGRFESLEHTSISEDGSSTLTIYTYFYDSLDRIIAVDCDLNGDGTLDKREHMQFDDNGNVVFFTFQDEAGAVVKTVTYSYEPTSEPIYNTWIRWQRYYP